MVVIENLKKCLNFAPLPVISLFIYMSLRSSTIFPEDVTPINTLQPPWQHAFLGWYDWLFFLSIAVSFALGSVKLDKKNSLFIWVVSLIILLSFINGITLGNEYILDTIVHFSRFIFAFSLGAWMVRCLGSKVTESLIICLFILLAFTSLFVYSIQFGTYNRIYASAMTVASFSQVAVVVCFIALIRRYKFILLISSCFLFLTFSRTSIILFFFILLCIFLKNNLNFNYVNYFFRGALLLIFVIFISLKLAESQFLPFFTRLIKWENILQLTGRVDIWKDAWHLLQSGEIPILGVGFNAASSLIAINNFKINTDGEIYYYTHFHSIFIEYGFGLGILSIFLFYFLFERTWKNFYYNCYPSFMIFAFFLMSQTSDFTFYRPKEVIIWSLILGIAEGQWSFERG